MEKSSHLTANARVGRDVYRRSVVMWSAVVKRFPRSPVGVAQKTGPGPLEVTFSVRGQTQPKVNNGVVKQGGDEGCEGEQGRIAHNEACESGLLTTILVRDGSVHTMRFSPSGGVTDTAASFQARTKTGRTWPQR